MIKVKEDLTGRIFGLWKVLEQTDDYIDASGNHYSRWLCECSCDKHTLRKIRGSELKSKKTQSCGCMFEKKNKYSDLMVDEYGKYYIGYTTNTNKEFYIDAENYEVIKDCVWYETYSGATTTIKTNIYKGNKRTTITMHQFLGFDTYDHIDKNELNNRKYNLRPCSHQQNCCNRRLREDNTSGFTGVYKHPYNYSKWRAQLNYNGKTYYGVARDTFEEAVVDRLKLEAKHMMSFAPNISLFEQYGITIPIENLEDDEI